MDIAELPPHEAAVLVPLNLQVQAIHSAHDPKAYVTDPAPSDVAQFLVNWLAEPNVTALIAGPQTAPTGYLIYEITSRAPSCLRRGEVRVMLHHLCVDQNHRRKGIARNLIQAMKVRADVQSASTVWTSYGAFNTASAAVMRDAGFQEEMVFAKLPNKESK